MTHTPSAPFAFFESIKRDGENRDSFLFQNATEVIATRRVSGVVAALDAASKKLKQGFYLAGYVAYEAGYAFEPALGSKGQYSFPLVWFGVYPNRKRVSFSALSPKVAHAPGYDLFAVEPGLSKSDYVKALAKIRRWLAAGDTYQVNFTFPLCFQFYGNSLLLYAALRKQQPVSYAAYLRGQGFDVLSFSPELFFRKKARLIWVKPMKGTGLRGKTKRLDSRICEAMKKDLKTRAENLMIVDLLRNDLGRLAMPGSVKAEKLFHVEQLSTLQQMTSTVRAKLKPSVSLTALFQALFPSGSVTGAPKIKTMTLIQQLETQPRGIYTGAIGFICPNGDAVFNVGIRTLWLDDQGKGRMGIGSGIVYDSIAESEYKESLAKAQFFTREAGDFSLFETLLWTKKTGFYLLSGHLRRLSASAKYFSFNFQRKRILAELGRVASRFSPSMAYRVRLVLNSAGKVQATAGRLPSAPESGMVCLSRKTTWSGSVFYQHKTTARILYDQEYLKARKKGFLDVLFTNEKGHLTEGAISNLIIRKGELFYTPPLSDGVLDGVFRRHLIKRWGPRIVVKSLLPQDLLRADAIFICNSVRGIRPVRLEKDTGKKMFKSEARMQKVN